MWLGVFASAGIVANTVVNVVVDPEMLLITGSRRPCCSPARSSSRASIAEDVAPLSSVGGDVRLAVLRVVGIRTGTLLGEKKKGGR